MSTGRRTTGHLPYFPLSTLARREHMEVGAMVHAGMRIRNRGVAAVSVTVFLLFPHALRGGDIPIINCSASLETRCSSDTELLLRRHGVVPDAPGLKRYLSAIEPCAKKQVQVRALIDRLGDHRFGKRVDANRALFTELSRQPHLTRIELTNALTHRDEEIRHRAAALLLRVDEVAQQVLLAALRVIAQRKVRGLTAEVVAAMPYCDTDYLRDASHRALLATVCRRDAPFLREQAARPETDSARLAAIVALERAAGAGAQSDLLPLLDSKCEQVRLAAATAMVHHEPRRALQVVAPLLDSETEKVRSSAATLLRSITGQKFGYTSFDPLSSRATSVAHWNEWIRDNADERKLCSPVAPLKSRKHRALVCTFNPFRVKEVGLQGQNLFDSDVADSACGAVVLPNGRRVLADWGSKSLIFIDANGQKTHTFELPGTPNGLDLLENGNLLVPLFHEKSLIEVTSTGQVAWQIELEGRPTDARRLPGGSTLVALNSNDQIIEINRQGEIVWSIENVRSPESARRLGNGNTLVAMRLGVKEYDPAGKEIWSLEDLSSPYDAILLDNGNLLVGHAGGLREVSREGQAIREFPLGTVRRIFYH